MKNPWMSLWLSGANSWAGAARGMWTAELHRQQTAMLNEMTKQMVRFWTGGWMLPGGQGKTSGQRSSRT
jgi:hypothetical protein